MKKIIIVFILLLTISGCTEKKEVNTFNDNITGYYQMVSGFKYFETDVISYIIGDTAKKYFVHITDEKIRLISKVDDNIGEMEPHNYIKEENMMILEEKNMNGSIQYKYELINNPMKNNIVLYEEQEIDGKKYTIRKEYEKISREEYLRKTGATYEK